MILKTMMQMPKTVNVKREDGKVVRIPFQRFKRKQQKLIDQSFRYGVLDPTCSEREILEYEKQEIDNWRELIRKIRKNPEIILTLNRNMNRYVVCV